MDLIPHCLVGDRGCCVVQKRTLVRALVVPIDVVAVPAQRRRHGGGALSKSSWRQNRDISVMAPTANSVVRVDYPDRLVVAGCLCQSDCLATSCRVSDDRVSARKPPTGFSDALVATLPPLEDFDVNIWTHPFMHHGSELPVQALACAKFSEDNNKHVLQEQSVSLHETLSKNIS